MAQHYRLTHWILAETNRKKRTFYINLLQRTITEFYKNKNLEGKKLPKEYNPEGYAYDFGDTNILSDDVLGGKAGIEIHTSHNDVITDIFLVA